MPKRFRGLNYIKDKDGIYWVFIREPNDSEPIVLLEIEGSMVTIHKGSPESTKHQVIRRLATGNIFQKNEVKT